MIYSRRLRLRAVERVDLPLFQQWLNDPEVTDGLTVVLPLSLADEDHWFDEMQKLPPAEHSLAIEVRVGDGWIPVGTCGFHNLETRCQEAELGIFIGDKNYWNKGYGTEAVKLLLTHGFGTLNLYRIFLRVHADNLRAVRCYEKVGFIHEGRMRHAMYKSGNYVDVLLMSVLRPEWKNPNPVKEE